MNGLLVRLNSSFDHLCNSTLNNQPYTTMLSLSYYHSIILLALFPGFHARSGTQTLELCRWRDRTWHFSHMSSVKGREGIKRHSLIVDRTLSANFVEQRAKCCLSVQKTLVLFRLRHDHVRKYTRLSMRI